MSFKKVICNIPVVIGCFVPILDLVWNNNPLSMASLTLSVLGLGDRFLDNLSDFGGNLSDGCLLINRWSRYLTVSGSKNIGC